VKMKRENVSNNAFKQLKRLIDSLNALLNKINYNSNGYLLLELELISFINDDENQISNRDINQIISREIISSDEKIDVNQMIKDNTSQVYKICTDFENIRINNTFVDANKDEKLKAGEMWKQFCIYVKDNNLTEFFSIIKSSTLQVASATNIIFITLSDSIKVVGNSKLYDLESKVNSLYNTNYKFIFITKNDWDLFMDGYSKDKKFVLIDETEYIEDNSNSVKLAEDIFGNDKLNIE
ncbi:MAG: hypothetical protein K2L98_04610, partial [Bacilli bacterium]|nr:hypothetical protein [Bacilli bacterium]